MSRSNPEWKCDWCGSTKNNAWFCYDLCVKCEQLFAKMSVDSTYAESDVKAQP